MAGRRRARNAGTRQKRAQKAVEYLEEVLDGSTSSDPELAQTAVRDLRRVVNRHSVKAPADLREKACRGCGVPFVHGRNVRVRIDVGVRVTTCLGCGRVSRKRMNQDVEQ
ncbi:MAG: hypothetical protein CL801_15040 [Citromicrobium sp.]|nr:hypothetical protein [Citromicrobium sp.]